MGIIQKQSIRSTLIIMIGFAIGAINQLLIAPKVLTAEQYGLTKVITDVGLTLATFSTLGSIAIIYKFFPFYKNYLKPKQNDLPFITLLICIVGFILVLTVGYFSKDLIVRKYSAKSPLFVQYSYLAYPLALFMLLFMWVEAFSWTLRRTVTSSLLKEVIPRLIFTILLVLFIFKIIPVNSLLWLFSLAYVPAFITLFIVLKNTGEFGVYPIISPVTQKIKGKMANFGLYLFGAQFLNLLSITSDSFILTAKSDRGLADAAVYTIATQIVTLMQIPQRSLTAISIPILSESWRNKDFKNINHIYNSSVSNLLVIGLAMFGLLWLNADTMVAYLGKDYQHLKMLVLLLGIGKLIDLGTGANEQILATSSFWRANFITNVLYTLVAIPLNYVLISHYGLVGAAYSTLISHTFYNIMRYIFLWYKFDMQPYTAKHLVALLIGVVAITAAYYLPPQRSVIIDAAIRSIVFSIILFPTVYFCKISTEINKMADKYVLFIFRKKEA